MRNPFACIEDGKGELVGRVSFLRDTPEGPLYAWRIRASSLYLEKKRSGQALGEQAAIRESLIAARALGIRGARARDTGDARELSAPGVAEQDMRPMYASPLIRRPVRGPS